MGNTIRRNDPCPCGKKCSNGLPMKYKNCCMNKKPRNHEILIGHRDKYKAVRHGPDGKVEIQTLDGEWVASDYVHTEFGYQRESGKKKYTSYIFDAHVIDFCAYLQSFDFIFAVDTNTKMVNGTIISSSCAFQVFVEQISQDEWRVVYAGPLLLRFKNGESGLDEKWSITMLVNHIARLPNVNEKKKIAIITDHDLGRHGAYNNQSRTLYKNVLLPTNFTLLYASSDSKNDNVLTFSVSKCDKAASDDLSFFEESGFFRSGDFATPVEQLIDVDNHSGCIGMPIFK